jgi:3-methyladenine DNA glycosylase AlkD
MDLTQVMPELERLGTPQNVQIYGRHGVTDPTFGVSYAHLGMLKRRIKTNHALGIELWATGNHDARVLATMVADASQLTPRLLEAWVQELSDYATTDAFAKLAARSVHAPKKAAQWSKRKHEYVSRAGWDIIALLAMNDPRLSDEVFKTYLEQIAGTVHIRPNRTREAMNNALIAIGARNANLEHEALEVAARIGRVQVDHGLTNCKTPDAAQSIFKTIQKKGYAQSRHEAV